MECLLDLYMEGKHTREVVRRRRRMIEVLNVTAIVNDDHGQEGARIESDGIPLPSLFEL
jgi:hypothetical protein